MKVKEYFLEEQDLQKRLKLIKKIFHLCMEINSQGEYYAFYHLFPHSAGISVHITPKGDYKHWLYNYDCHYDCNFKTHEEMLSTLNKVVSDLIKYLRDSNE